MVVSENKINLTITTNTGEFTEPFDLRVRVAYLKIRAVIVTNIRPEGGMVSASSADRYWLSYKGSRLPDNKTLKEVGLPDGAQLRLEGPFLHGLI